MSGSPVAIEHPGCLGRRPLIRATTSSWGAYVDSLDTAMQDAQGVDGVSPTVWAEETRPAARQARRGRRLLRQGPASSIGNLG